MISYDLTDYDVFTPVGFWQPQTQLLLSQGQQRAIGTNVMSAIVHCSLRLGMGFNRHAHHVLRGPGKTEQSALYSEKPTDLPLKQMNSLNLWISLNLQSLILGACSQIRTPKTPITIRRRCALTDYLSRRCRLYIHP